MESVTITIFTATYNRANSLPRLFDSLKKQTSYDFEWIVVDDGSTDNTGSVLSEIDNEVKPFAFRYLTVPNGGKCRAINMGVKMSRGLLFFIVDSDDWLESNAIEVFIDVYKGIKNASGFAGIMANKQSRKGAEPLCFDGEYLDATALERARLGRIGEKAEAYYTAVLRQYPFPEFEGENFVSEGIVWNRIAADGYKLRWIKNAVYNFEYLDGGLTSNMRDNYRKNPRGYLTYVEQENRLHRRPWLQRMSQCGLCIKTVRRSDISKDDIRRLLRLNPIEYAIAPLLHSLKTRLCLHAKTR